MIAVSYFVLVRILDARHRPWKASMETDDLASAERRMRLLGQHPKLEAQLVASSALRADEIARYRAEVTVRG